MRPAACGRPAPPAHERGVALLVVLLAIALLTVVVVEFTHSAQVAIHGSLSARNALQAHYLARSGVNLAEAVLMRERLFGGDDTDSEHDLWAQPFPPLPVGDGTVAVRIRDEARALNLNDMLSVDGERAERIALFERLFEILGVERSVLAAIIDWLDADDEPWPSPPGAEQSFYLGLTPPVAVRNGPLITLRELLLVRGVTPRLVAALDGFVTVLPAERSLRVNVNTAPPEVLYALSPRLAGDPGIVDRLLATRRDHALTSDGDLRAVPGVPEAWDGPAGLRERVRYGSTYFRIEALGAVDDTVRGVTAVVRRDGGRLTRALWTPRVRDDRALTSQAPSDFLQALPPLGGG